ncbi:MAG: RNA methyltransferase [Erysipelotrichaceae bacterium]|nr:RNA methyltransferase [Erysipelotrichaceae bacterium]
MLITSPDNPHVREWEKLKQAKYRDRSRQFIIEQPHMIEEAIRRGCLDTLLVRQGVECRFDMPYTEVSDAVMRRISTNVSLNDYAGICRYLDQPEPEGNTFIILDAVQDPGNVGTIIRTAYSLGYDAVYLNDRCAGIYNPKTIQSSQGAFFHIPCIMQDTEKTINELHEKGCTVIATSLKGNTELSKTEKAGRYALVFGNEGQGLSEETENMCDRLIRIRMNGFDSLNVAIAMGISAYVMKNK